MLDFFLSLSLPDCCFTHTVKLVHGRARGRNTVHITCSTVCGCPDSSSREPLRHHLLHDSRAARLTCNAASFPLKFEENILNIPGFFRWKVDCDESGLMLWWWNDSKISQKLIEYLLCQSVVQALTFPFIDWPSASQSLGNSCIFFPSHSFTLSLFSLWKRISILEQVWWNIHCYQLCFF